MMNSIEPPDVSLRSQRLLSRNRYLVCIFCGLAYVICQSVMLLDLQFSSNPVCKRDISYTRWTWYANFAQTGGFVTSLILTTMKVSRFTDRKEGPRTAYLAPWFTILIGSINSILGLITLSWGGGVCVDAFGVQTPPFMWAEWLACAPLELYIAVSIDDRPTLSKEEFILIGSFFTAIIFSFLLIFSQPFYLACIWLILANLCYLSVFRIVFMAKKSLLEARLSFLPTATMETYQDILDSSTISLINEKYASEARSNFLRYIFHELRVPLNSFVMGIEILKKKNDLDNDDEETLLMMNEASGFMRETLTNVLQIQQIEEDYGPGISNEHQKHLFSTFMNIRPGEIEGNRGSGISLASCKQIVTMHGGTLKCVSDLGKGSTFSFTIPFKLGTLTSSLTSSEGDSIDELQLVTTPNYKLNNSKQFTSKSNFQFVNLLKDKHNNNSNHNNNNNNESAKVLPYLSSESNMDNNMIGFNFGVNTSRSVIGDYNTNTITTTTTNTKLNNVMITEKENIEKELNLKRIGASIFISEGECYSTPHLPVTPALSLKNFIRRILVVD
eukprot:gene7568-15518_t